VLKLITGAGLLSERAEIIISAPLLPPLATLLNPF